MQESLSAERLSFCRPALLAAFGNALQARPGVRSLAQRSAAAAKEIKQLIADSVGRVDDGTRLVDEAGKTMQEVVEAIQQVTEMMEDINTASAEQMSGIESVDHAVRGMEQANRLNAGVVESAAQAAHGLRDQTAQLLELIAVFKLGSSQAGQPGQVGEPVRPVVATTLPAQEQAGQQFASMLPYRPA